MSDRRAGFVARFRNVAAERLARVRAALDGRDEDEARRELHSLKGEARVVGFEAVARIAHALEERLEARAPRHVIEEGLALIDHALGLDPSAEPSGLVAFLEGRASPSIAPSSEALGALAQRAAESFLRVDLAVLTQLTRAIGELSATERELRALEATLREGLESLGALRARDDRPIRAALEAVQQIAFDHRQRTQLVTEGLRRLRMVPLRELFEPFPRAVAQLAAQLGKRAELRVIGADVEVDRQVLEVVTEPLLHLLRNAVDHGLEPPDERRAQGKPPIGALVIRASARGGWARIEVEDDGRGIDAQAVRRAAGAMDGDELLELLCRHGLSTRTEITEVSGRGVGLDVVKRRVESVGGRLALWTEPGLGTRFELELPASMVLGAMVCVDVDDARYAFAPHEVTVVLDAATLEREPAGRGVAVRVDGRAVPLFDLGVLTERVTAPRSRERVLVLQHGARSIAVGIDAFRGTRHVSEQRLDPFLEGLAIVRSVAVLSTGMGAEQLAVVLDPAELVRRADALHEPVDVGDVAPRSATRRPERVLVVDDSELTRDMIVAVLREMGLEVIEAVNGAQALERLGTTEVRLVLTDLDMPVLDGFELLARIRARHGRLPVIVLSSRGSDEDVRRTADLGADAYFVKGRLELEALRRVVRRYLELA
jgi:chemotaxis protein histidine kinase CheA